MRFVFHHSYAPEKYLKLSAAPKESSNSSHLCLPFAVLEAAPQHPDLSLSSGLVQVPKLRLLFTPCMLDLLVPFQDYNSQSLPFPSFFTTRERLNFCPLPFVVLLRKERGCAAIFHGKMRVSQAFLPCLSCCAPASLPSLSCPLPHLILQNLLKLEAASRLSLGLFGYDCMARRSLSPTMSSPSFDALFIHFLHNPVAHSLVAQPPPFFVRNRKRPLRVHAPPSDIELLQAPMSFALRRSACCSLEKKYVPHSIIGIYHPFTFQWKCFSYSLTYLPRPSSCILSTFLFILPLAFQWKCFSYSPYLLAPARASCPPIYSFSMFNHFFLPSFLSCSRQEAPASSLSMSLPGPSQARVQEPLHFLYLALPSLSLPFDLLLGMKSNASLNDTEGKGLLYLFYLCFSLRQPETRFAYSPCSTLFTKKNLDLLHLKYLFILHRTG